MFLKIKFYKIILVQESEIYSRIKNKISNFRIVRNNKDNIIALITTKKNYNNLKNIIPFLKNLKTIGIMGNSMGKLNLNYPFSKDIKVINTGNIYGRTCAEFLLMLCILGIRKASLSHDRMKMGGWGVNKFNNNTNIKVDKNFYSSSIGVLGYGFITEEFLKLLVPFDNKVRLYSKSINNNVKKTLENKVIFSNISNTIEYSDIVIINRGLSEKTKNSFSKNEIDKLKPGTILINISRAKIVNNEYLYNRLLKNDIFYCVDVYENEPINSNFKLKNLPNVFLTSHMAGSSNQINEESYSSIFENVINFLINGDNKNIISKNRYFNSHCPKFKSVA